jgi:hypothetical protein
MYQGQTGCPPTLEQSTRHIWPRESGGSRSCATCMNPRMTLIIPPSHPEGGPPTLEQSTPSHLAPRIRRVALLRDLHEPANDIDNSTKPPRGRPSNVGAIKLIARPRESGGSRSCATCMNPRMILIIPASRPEGCPPTLEQSTRHIWPRESGGSRSCAT